MTPLLKALLVATIRIEKKLDELLKLSLADAKQKRGPLVSVEPLSYPTQGACPLCQKKVMYVPTMYKDAPNQVLIRVCGCEPQANQLPVQGDE